MEQFEFSDTVGGNVNWVSHFGKLGDGLPREATPVMKPGV